MPQLDVYGAVTQNKDKMKKSYVSSAKNSKEMPI
jgi:hypothetical protein